MFKVLPFTTGLKFVIWFAFLLALINVVKGTHRFQVADEKVTEFPNGDEHQQPALPDKDGGDDTLAEEKLSYDYEQTTVKNPCACHRHKKMTELGFDIAGNVIRRDVGQCRSTYNGRHHGSRALKYSNNKKLSLCGCACVVNRSLREYVYLTEGLIRETDVVDGCDCLDPVGPCNRTGKTVVLFDGSPYRTEVDVGSCHGQCANSDTKCRPSRNKTVTVEGPNGAVCVSTIQECACAGDCYRMQHLSVMSDTIWNSSQNSSGQLLKEIDVGRCVGQCESSSSKNHCVMWDRKDSRKCLMSLTNRNSRCVPSSYDTHVFTSVNGESKTVLSIARCSCT